MSQNNLQTNFRVAQKAFKAKNMLSIESNIQASKKSFEMNHYSFLENIIYFKLANGIGDNGRFTYDTKNQIVMQLNSNDLRSLMYACKELYQNKVSNFKLFTQPGLSNNTQTAKKILSLAYQDVYFLNIDFGNVKSSFIFDKYLFLSFIDSLKIICDETEKILYNYQRKNDYKMKTVNT